MRKLANLAAAVLLGGCAAESAESELVPAPSGCIQMDGTSAQATGKPGSKTRSDDLLAPSAATSGCPAQGESEGDNEKGSGVTPKASNVYLVPVKTKGGLDFSTTTTTRP